MNQEKLFLLVALLLVSFVGLSQVSELISYQDNIVEELPSECQLKLDNWSSVKNNEEILFVQIQSIESIQSEGRINFRLPQNSDIISATADHIKSRPDGSLVWSGIIDCYDGNVVLIEKDDYTFGYINYKGETFTIKKLCDGLEVIITHPEESKEDQCGNALESQFDNESDDHPLIESNDLTGHQSSCISTMLIVYTDLALAQGDPVNDADLLYENTLIALENSNVKHSISLVGIEHVEWNGDELGGPMIMGLESVTFNAQINMLRDEKGADIVMVLTGDGYADVFGISWLDQLDAEHGYTITEITSPAGQQTFPHEWAHDLGCRHDLIVDQTPGFAHGMRFFGGSTILGYLFSTAESRELHYSNPDVFFNGNTTGVEDRQDNARQLDDYGCTVANYKHTSDPCDDFVSLIEGSPFTVTGVDHELCAEVFHCDDDEVSFEWEYFNIDVFDWVSIGQDECFTFTAASANIHIRLKTTCSTGCEYTDYMSTVIAGIDKGCVESRFKQDNKSKLKDFALSPNPSSDYITFNSSSLLTNKDDYEIVLYNLYGQSISLGSFKGLDLKSTKFDISNYAKGSYFISIESEKEFAVSKLIIN